MTRFASTRKVWLVGAGPGDPGLLTIKAARLLERAEVVVYDALVSPRVLQWCGGAELIYVGKRAADHSATQDEINAILIDKAKAGRRVVRLKGGDPFVFGRGGEECEALAGAGIEFEVVPGITAAIAAPAYAGIPVTHRDFNSSFTLITGHEREDEFRDPRSSEREGMSSDHSSHGRESVDSSTIDWSVIAKLPCIAFYMGVKSLPRICAKLIEHGMDPAMPAASIQWGTTPRQRTIVSTVADLPQRVAETNITPPALTIIGKVVSLRPVMNWFEAKPLFGQTIVVTRTRQQASELSEKLEDFGAVVIEAPTIEIAPPYSWEIVDAALTSIATFDWLIFTSANGVAAAKDRMLAIGLDARAFANVKIAAIGDATAKAIRDQLCLNVDLCPESFVAEALADALVEKDEVKGKRFLLLRADIARPILRERLTAAGAARVDDVAVYETRAVKQLPPQLVEMLDAGKVNWITFTSSSTAKNFAALLGADYLKKLYGIRIASIGPVTTATLKELGLTPTVQAETFNIDGVVESILSAKS